MTAVTIPWATVAPIGTARTDFGCTTDGSGRIYAIGGPGPTSAVERYDPNANAWSAVASMAAGSRNKLTAAKDSSGRVYALGGLSNTGAALTRVERFDPTTGAWSTLASLNFATYSLAAATDSSGRVYAFGGNSGSAVVGYIQRFDPTAGTWTSLASLPAMPTPRQNHAGAADGQGRIYAIGGLTSAGTVVATVERFDPSTGAWSTLTPMPTARQLAAATTDAQGRIYVIGGRNASNTQVATVERFDPGTGAWDTLTSMPTARQSLGAATDASGRIYAVSGSGAALLSTVERATPNVAPNAPALTSPANNAPIDRGITQRFAWTFSDPDTGDSQSAFDLQYRLIGAATWTTVSSTTPNSFYDFAAGTFAAGNYEWQVRTYDAVGTQGPWSASSFFTAATAPAAPTITAPVNGSTVINTATVTWSAPNQTDYEIRRVADNAGAANTSVVYWDSGDVIDGPTRSVTVAFDTNNRWEHVQVRIKYATLWSAWADARVQVSYTAPPTPTRTLTPFDATGLGFGDNAFSVAITNPAPGAGQPAVAYNEVWVDDADGAGLTRRATALPTNTPWTYATPRSGIDYDNAAGRIVVIAVATNGTTARST